MVEVRFVDIEVHHARIGASNLCNVGVAEASAHLCGAAPVFYLCLYQRVATLNDTRNHGMSLAGTFQVGNHFAYGTAGIQLTEPCGNVGLLVVGGFLLLYVHQYDGYIQVAYCR